MKAVRTLQKYKCDFCTKRMVKQAMERHEPRCYRNPKRYCDYCENQGYTMETILEGYGDVKQACPFCSRFDEKKKKAIEEYEAKQRPEEIHKSINAGDIPF